MDSENTTVVTTNSTMVCPTPCPYHTACPNQIPPITVIPMNPEPPNWIPMPNPVTIPFVPVINPYPFPEVPVAPQNPFTVTFPWPTQPEPQRLSEEDIEKIARRVVELLKEQK